MLRSLKTMILETNPVELRAWADELEVRMARTSLGEKLPELVIEADGCELRIMADMNAPANQRPYKPG